VVLDGDEPGDARRLDREGVEVDRRLARLIGAWILSAPLGSGIRMIGSLVAIPAEILNALRVLPRLLDEVQRVAEYTSALPRVDERIGAVAEDASVLPSMYERMASIEEAMPTLVDVQRRLADLPNTMEHLEGEMGGLGELLQRLLASLDQLDANVSSLREAVEPLARVADRLPLRGRC
jgi:DNA repair ATPase RecN